MAILARGSTGFRHASNGSNKSGSSILLALACATFSLPLSGAASLTFLRAETTLNPQQPQKVTTLVTAGVFSLSRNPIYLAQLLFLVAWALLLTGGLMCWSGCLLYFIYLQRW